MTNDIGVPCGTCDGSGYKGKEGCQMCGGSGRLIGLLTEYEKVRISETIWKVIEENVRRQEDGVESMKVSIFLTRATM